jgi:hypothetical protein
VVPSLRIFAPAATRTRPRRIQRLFLLLSRAAILVALFLLVSQPYLESDRELPLPVLAGSTDPYQFLGVVVDDSLTALHGEQEAERLERSKSWLLEQLDRLPDTVRVSVVTTSCSQPTGFLARRKAASLIERLSVVSREGNASEALLEMADLLRRRPGALVVAAPLEKSLWPVADSRPKHSEPTGAKRIDRLFFLDTTRYRTEPYIRRAAARAGAGGHLSELAGSQEALAGKRLRLRNARGETVWKHEISVHEALSKKVVVDTRTCRRGGYEISLEGKGPSHRWRHYFVTAGTRVRRADRFALFAASASPAARVIDTIVRALRPDIPRFFVPLSSDAAGDAMEELPDASAAVFVGGRGVTPRVLAWLERQLDGGIQVVCFPPGSGDAAGEQEARAVPGGRLPGWEDASLLAGPFRVHGAQLPASHRLDDVLLGDWGDFALQRGREPVFPRRGRSVITTEAGRTLLALSAPNPRSSVWALGMPITLEEGSLVYHPLFPLLLDWLLFPSGRAAGASQGDARVGENVELGAWFGREPAGADLLLPSGETLPLGQDRKWLPVSAPGVYELRAAGDSEFRVANHRRAREDGACDRESWQNLGFARRTVWLSGDDFLAARELEAFSVEELESPPQRYDLSSVAALFLLMFLVSEAGFLARCWRRAGDER